MLLSVIGMEVVVDDVYLLCVGLSAMFVFPCWFLCSLTTLCGISISNKLAGIGTGPRMDFFPPKMICANDPHGLMAHLELIL